MVGGENTRMLTGEEVKKLAKLVHYQEQNRIKSIAFKSEMARGQYLRDSQETYQLAVNLVDEAANLQQDNHNDNDNDGINKKRSKTTAQIINHYVGYVEYGVGTALRVMWNVHLRNQYLKKHRAHADTLLSDMHDINGRLAETEAEIVKVTQRKAQAQAEKTAQLEKAAELKAQAEAAEALHIETEAEAKRAAQLEAETAAESAAKIEAEAVAEEAAQAQELAHLEEEAEALAKKLVDYKKVQYDYMLKWKNPCARNFSKMLKTKGVTFEKMVQKYQLKLVREKGSAYGGKFKDLDDAKKIEVYDEIVKSSGRGSLLTNRLALGADVAGKALLVIALGNMVWDIYSSDSEHRLQTGVKDGAELTASVVGGIVGEYVGGAIASSVAATTVGTEVATSIAVACGFEVAAVSSAFVCLAAAATGFGIGIALGILVGLAVTKIFESGGEHASKIVKVQGPNSSSLVARKPRSIHVYAAPMPNGDLLARQLAYQG